MSGFGSGGKGFKFPAFPSAGSAAQPQDFQLPSGFAPPIASKPAKTMRKAKFLSPVQRSSARTTTIATIQKSTQARDEKSKAPVKGHVSATGRAVEPGDVPTAQINAKRIAALVWNKAYKQDTVRVHFKGARYDDDTTSGSPLGGAHIDRSPWSKDEKTVNQHLGQHLSAQSGFISAPHRGGEHGAEDSHVRRQGVGGLTDPLGAQPASWHYNVEDMAREEAEETLHKTFGDRVRMKSTAYVHASGEFAGTVKARRHKISFWNDKTKAWETKLDHLQDGHRGNIDENEARALREHIRGLGPDSLTVSLHEKKNPKGIDPQSSVDAQATFVPKSNDTTASPYFTDLQSTDDQKKFRRRGSSAGEFMQALFHKAAQDIAGADKSRVRTMKKQRTGKAADATSATTKTAAMDAFSGSSKR